MNYRNVADLNRDIVALLPRLPQDIELVVGIPRSGLLAANFLSLHRNLQMTDIDGLLSGRVLSAGLRLTQGDISSYLQQPRQVLVLDDSLCTGFAMERARQRIAEAGLKHSIRYAAVYVTPEGASKVDLFYETVSWPRCFEWNCMHHPLMKDWCIDIDGVLCQDPTPEENDDGERYQEFLSRAHPLFLPTVEIGWLVTCRLEKYRGRTEEWLHRHGVRYQELLMMDYPDKASRLAAGAHARFKAEAYLRTGAGLFIESSFQQAIEISGLTGKEVLCMETRELVRPPSEVLSVLSRAWHGEGWGRRALTVLSLLRRGAQGASRPRSVLGGRSPAAEGTGLGTSQSASLK